MKYLRYGIVVAVLASAVAGCDGSGDGDGGDKPVASKLPDSAIEQMKNKFLPQKQSKGGPQQGKKSSSPSPR